MTNLSRHERQTQLRTTISKSSFPRPLFTHLNTDASWLCSIPIPASETRPPNAYFHILLDAWLTPSNSASEWLLKQYHVETPACQSIAEVLDLITDIEDAASGAGSASATGRGKIDAILLSNDIQDHANIDTLTDADPKTPVFCPAWAVKTIKSWKHFEIVLPIEKFGDNEQFDWRGGDRGSFDEYLPKWLGLFWLGREKAYPNLHTATMIVYDESFGKGGDGSDGVRGVIITTHGLEVECAKVVSRAEPKIDVLALFHTTRDAWTPTPLIHANLGAASGLQVFREVKPKYWIATHDEVQRSTGILPYFFSENKVISKEAVEIAVAEEGLGLEMPRFVEVGNGESFLVGES